MSNFVSVSVHQIVTGVLDRKTWRLADFKINLDLKRRDDTFLTVFNLQENKAEFEAFKNQADKYFNILFESPPAVNTRYSKTQPRNILVIYEFK